MPKPMASDGSRPGSDRPAGAVSIAPPERHAPRTGPTSPTSPTDPIDPIDPIDPTGKIGKIGTS